ncbi:MAG: SIMPL domain-containing protein [Pseudomonadales bacterium]
MPCRGLFVVLPFLLLQPVHSLGADSLLLPTNQVSFSVVVERQVPNDWTRALVGITIADADPAALARRVNATISEALGIARKSKALTVSSATYTTYPEYGDDNRIVRWRASQDVILEGADTAAITHLIAELQSRGLLLRNITFTLAAGTRAAVENELIAGAIQAFRNRAVLISRGFDKSSYSIVSVSVGDNGYPQPTAMMENNKQMLSGAVEPPEFEPGSSTLRIDVSGTIELQ